MRHGSQPPLTYKVVARDHRFMTMLFIVLGVLVFGSVILCALGMIEPLS